MGTELVPEVLLLDSWPLLEWIKGREPARTHFNALAQKAMASRAELHISRINSGEAIYSIHKAPEISDIHSALRRLRSTPIHVHSVDDALVDEAVHLKSRYTFSYADPFAGALAMRLGVPLVTGDRAFRSLEKDGLIRLHWVGA